MNKLPDMIVLDFLEWLKTKKTTNTHSQTTDVLELILYNENDYQLEVYAQEYLDDKEGQFGLATLNCTEKIR